MALKGEVVEELPKSRSSGGKNAKLIEEFVESGNSVLKVTPERVYRDEVKRRKQVSSTYNTLKYHIGRIGLTDKVSVTVRNWEVYLQRAEQHHG